MKKVQLVANGLLIKNAKSEYSLTELENALDKAGIYANFYQRDNWTTATSLENAVYFSCLYKDENNNPDFSTKVDGKLPENKNLTVSWFANKLANKQQKQSINYKSLFKQLPKIDGSYYVTTYGFGVDLVFRSDKNKNIANIKAFLDKHNIDYKTEFSDAHYVYRFKLSQSKDNIIKLKNLTN